MRPAAIVEIEIAPDPCVRRADAFVGVEVDLLVLDRAPESFDEDVVPPRPLPSMLILMSFAVSTPVKDAPVNWSVSLR